MVIPGREHDEAYRRQPLILADAFGQFDAVHPRHLIVQQREIESRPFVRIEHGERVRAGFLRDDLHTPGTQVPREDFAIAGVVVDDERLQSHQPHPRQAGERWGSLDHRRQPNFEPEYRTAPHHAVDADLTAHQRRKLAADGQPQARAAVFPRSKRVGLAEGIENVALRFGRDADARVDHFESQQIIVGQELDAHDHFSGIGEFDGVAHQVDQNLAQPHRIAAHFGRHIEPDIACQLEPLGVGARRANLDCLLHRFTQAKLDAFKFEFARLDL